MTHKITQPIVGYKVLTEVKDTELIVPVLESVHEELKRPAKLHGTTYKIKPMGHDSALYLTVNNITMNIDTEHEQAYPYEIFLNSKQMQSYQWISTVTRLVSAIFRKGGNITFIVDELEQIFDPNGGYWGKEPGSKKGKYYNSVIAELGAVLRQHMIYLGLIKGVKNIAEEQKDKKTQKESTVSTRTSTRQKPVNPTTSNTKNTNTSNPDGIPGFVKTGKDCPDCGHEDMQIRDGCYTCLECGYSKCG